MPNTSVEITTKNTVALTLGIIATVVGVFALLVGWVPFFGLFAIPAAIIGLMLAAAGFIAALVKSGKGIGLPLVGGLICAGALILPILSTSGASAAYTKVIEEARARNTANAHVKVENAPSSAVETPATVAEKPIPEAPKIVWNESASALRIGDIQLKIKEVKVGKVALKRTYSDSESESADELLTISVEVSNLSAAKKIDFNSWRGGSMSFDRNFGTLTDDNDNSYKRINFGASLNVVGGIGERESIYPAASVTDVLVFEKPVAAAKYLHLELPAKNFKGEGMVRLEILASAINK